MSECASPTLNAPTSHRKQKPIRTLLFGLIVTLAAFAYFSRYCDNSLFTSDAADYFRSADGGFVSSYFDTKSVGLWGAIAILRQRPDSRAHLWDFLERQDDAAAMRHFHVAPGFYGNAVARDWGADNRTHRLVMAAVGAVAIGIMFVGLRLVGVGLFLAMVVTSLAALSPAVVSTSTDISPHASFLAALLAAGFAFARYLDTNDRGWAIGAGISLGLAIATCELSIVILAAFGMLIALRAFHYGLRSTLTWLLLPSLVFLATLTLLWPGGILRGSYILSYGVFTFQALFRRESYFGAVEPSVSIMRGAQGSLLIVLVMVILGGAVLILHLTRRSNPNIQVFSWLALGFLCQGLLNRFQSPTYAAHFIVLAWILFALTGQQWLDVSVDKGRIAILAGVGCTLALAILAALKWPAASARANDERRIVADHAEQFIVLATDAIPAYATVLTNNEHEIWQLYLPNDRIEQSIDKTTLHPRPWVALPDDYWIIADPLLLSTDWNKRLNAVPSSGSAGGLVLAHIQESSVLNMNTGVVLAREDSSPIR
jgi:hypothetical protein